jgi:GDSL-like Lipase/Acylhydrolase family
MRRPCRIGRSVQVAAGAVAVALLAALALTPVADALVSRFKVNDGAAYSRGLRVAAGDQGWSPFFSPAVVVWDGGSIIAGHGAGPGYDFPTQTLSLVPRVCQSHLSITGGATIADMLADAPDEVDAHYRAAGDLNLCVVLAGGGDFHDGASAASVFASLKSYCSKRRAAGFRVVVVTVLPSSDPVTFEATRLAFDGMVRASWKTFADGLADIAADPRIGDTGDNLDRQFYGQDGLHPNNAGNAVMASVAAPVLQSQPWVSAQCELRIRDAAGEWGAWRPYTALTTLWLTDSEGRHVVEAEYRLGGGAPVVASDDIFVDTVRPTPLALRNVIVRRGHLTRLPFRVDDAQPCGPTCTAVVTVTTRGGKVLRTFVRRLVPIGQASAVTFTGGLARGRYRYVVEARDTAGNPQSVAGSANLTVR